jgi:Mn2+/Fe2+ NRAMP family transporter
VKRPARSSDLRKALGPGILAACAAIGGSHLVWSTRAGADFGWSLLWIVLLANLLKFPFFLYGQRYTAATGESLLAGYLRHGVVYVWIFLLINVLTGAINIAGVGMLSGALLATYGVAGDSVPLLTLGLLVACALLVLVGRYQFLDGLAKGIIAFLAFGTLVAFVLAIPSRATIPAAFVSPSPYTLGSFVFIVSLLGWMPAPVDLSAWSSLWMFSRRDQTGHFATVRESAVDFYAGYVTTTLLAGLFLGLGALVMFGTGEHFSDSGIAFSRQFVHLYAATIGDWSRPLILSAAFMTMFSTTLTCIDGYPRSLAACCALIGNLPSKRFGQIHRTWVVVSVVLAGLIVLTLVENLLQLLTFAAVLSFLTSPVLAFINYKVMRGGNVPPEARPGALLDLLSRAGLVFFALMAFAYLYTLFTGA